MPNPSLVDALQLAVSPVILLSAYGLLLLSMTNRLGRVIDRSRQIVSQPTINQGNQVEILFRRARWIRSAILFIALAILQTASLVLVLFISIFISVDVQVVIVLLFVVSLLCLVIGVGFFIIDIFATLKALRTEFSAYEHP